MFKSRQSKSFYWDLMINKWRCSIILTVTLFSTVFDLPDDECIIGDVNGFSIGLAPFGINAIPVFLLTKICYTTVKTQTSIQILSLLHLFYHNVICNVNINLTRTFVSFNMRLISHSHITSNFIDLSKCFMIKHYIVSIISIWKYDILFCVLVVSVSIR